VESLEDAEANDAVHAAAADLFRQWLAEHKAQVAKETEVRLLLELRQGVSVKHKALSMASGNQH
jgi:predicted ATPase